MRVVWTAAEVLQDGHRTNRVVVHYRRRWGQGWRTVWDEGRLSEELEVRFGARRFSGVVGFHMTRGGTPYPSPTP